jgi:fucose permease
VRFVPSTVRACSLAFIGFGVAAASLGPILPGVRHDLGVGDVGTGLAISAAGAGWGSGVLTSSRVSRARGRRVSFASGTTLIAIGLALLAAAPIGAVVIGAAFLFSFGGGLLTGAANSALAEADDGSLAVANGWFGVGAVAGPLIASALVGVGPGWRAAPAVAAVLCACTIPLARSLPAGKLPASPERHGARGLLRRRLYVLFVAVIAIDIAAEAGFVGWIATYVDEARGFPNWLAAGSPMAFWLGVTTIRFLAVRAQPEPWLLIPMTGLAGTAVLLLLLVPGQIPALALIMAVGVCCGAVFPVVVGASARAFPNDIDTGTALMLGACGTLEMIVPLILGTAAALAGTTAAGLVVVVATFGIAASVAAIATVSARRPAAAYT